MYSVILSFRTEICYQIGLTQPVQQNAIAFCRTLKGQQTNHTNFHFLLFCVVHLTRLLNRHVWLSNRPTKRCSFCGPIRRADRPITPISTFVFFVVYTWRDYLTYTYDLLRFVGGLEGRTERSVNIMFPAKKMFLMRALSQAGMPSPVHSEVWSICFAMPFLPKDFVTYDKHWLSLDQLESLDWLWIWLIAES